MGTLVEQAEEVDKLKYNLYDMIKLVDKQGMVYHVKIISLANYDIAKMQDNVDMKAIYFSKNLTETDKQEKIFYICDDLNLLNEQNFVRTTRVFWDDIIDHEKTEYIVKRKIFRMTIIPTPTAGSRIIPSADTVLNQVKTLILNSNVSADITFEDMTVEGESELERLRKAYDLSMSLIENVKSMDRIEPLIAAAQTIDFEKLTTDVTNYLTSIMARMNMMDVPELGDGE